jgi:glucans biosynthesis protein C
VYPWYVLHQSLILLIAYLLLPLHLGPVLEPVLVFAGTIAGCWLLHELVIRRVPWLRPCFGLKPRQRVQPLTGQFNAPQRAGAAGA